MCVCGGGGGGNGGRWLGLQPGTGTSGRVCLCLLLFVFVWFKHLSGQNKIQWIVTDSPFNKPSAYKRWAHTVLGGKTHKCTCLKSWVFVFYHSNSSRILGGIGFCLSDVSFARQMAGRNWPDQVRTSEWRTDFHDLDEPVFLVQTRTEKWGLKKERKKICQLVLHLTPAAWKCGTLLAVTTKTLNYGSSGRIINHT